jgi:hypothetical protein
MRIRRQTVEHPFETMTAWMGATHFLTRTLEKVAERVNKDFCSTRLPSSSLPQAARW